MNVKALILWLLLAAPLWAQGFAGLGGGAEGFATPSPGTVLEFPADHGPHPDFRIEWWYLTANLRGADGRDYGVQWTLFRTALAPGEAEGWQSPQLWMGHAALTTPERHFVAERLARGGVGQAGAQAAPFEVWVDEWRMAGPDVSEIALTANGADFGYDLNLSADGPLIPQGAGGYSVKSAGGQASHYYSQPFYRVAGTLHLPEGSVSVSGQGWLDREWSSQPLEATQEGWDWISLHLDEGAKLMGFQLRQSDGTTYTSGTWIGADGRAEPFGDGALRMTPVERAAVAGRDLPVGWRVELPGRGLDVTLRALNPESWMDTLFPYWEGPVRVGGSHPGRGYLEMTGY
ncbi:lipocalin-like domain-containing protein [Actibacterium sp. MT2.3-13A]|uniref:lipocalin-like domain-containing protein n=1 Tax=Actibacterium sp. MT2.3-13A TaxID=2828332 RepID=UPI001BAA4327|nr:lipocalin-like domain-containing protein [Actibacterium sp. MT2.3-13A]